MGAVAAVSGAGSGGRLGAWLRLGRVSNLPTVWTNALAATTLSGETLSLVAVATSMFLMSAFYVAGMILNDAFDAGYDAVHRPTRPIPSGVISKQLAFGAGVGAMVVATIGTGALAHHLGNGVVGAIGLAMALGGVILAYDAYHKTNPLSPVVMGACRALVYLTTAWAVSGRLSVAVVSASFLQWSYVVGLTYAAKQEDLARPGSLWPVGFVLIPPLWILAEANSRNTTVGVAVAAMLCSIGYGLTPLFSESRRIGVAIARLIAGIAVLDAMLIATTGWIWGVAMALLGAVLTRLGQRFVPGT